MIILRELEKIYEKFLQHFIFSFYVKKNMFKNTRGNDFTHLILLNIVSHLINSVNWFGLVHQNSLSHPNSSVRYYIGPSIVLTFSVQ